MPNCQIRKLAADGTDKTGQGHSPTCTAPNYQICKKYHWKKHHWNQHHWKRLDSGWQTTTNGTDQTHGERKNTMKSKVLEIRDVGTFIPMLAIDINPDDDDDYGKQWYLMRRCGYACDGDPNIVLTCLDAGGGPAWNDPYAWGGRTYPVAHDYIIKHWIDLVDGDVIDVEFILGESTTKKISERMVG
jgi:hypothetical protein